MERILGRYIKSSVLSTVMNEENGEGQSWKQNKTKKNKKNKKEHKMSSEWM